MTCHNCKHNREIAKLREICSKCTLGDRTAGGGGVSLDTIQDGTAARVLPVVPNRPTSYTFDPGKIDEQPTAADESERTRDALTTLLACVAALPYEQIAHLAKVAAVFQTLTRPEFEIVAHLLNGGTMIGYAEAHGLTKQTAFARIKALFKARPVFRAIANGGLGRGKGGRKPTERATYQPGLFDLKGC